MTPIILYLIVYLFLFNDYETINDKNKSNIKVCLVELVDRFVMYVLRRGEVLMFAV